MCLGLPLPLGVDFFPVLVQKQIPCPLSDIHEIKLE